MTIGLQKTSYSVYETDKYQVVCAEILSGDIAGRSIDISYTTEGDTAEGILTFAVQRAASVTVVGLMDVCVFVCVCVCANVCSRMCVCVSVC